MKHTLFIGILALILSACVPQASRPESAPEPGASSAPVTTPAPDATQEAAPGTAAPDTAAPSTAAPDTSTSTPEPAPPEESLISYEGQVGPLAAIGESVDALLSRGAVALQTYESPPSTLYQLPGSDSLFFTCNTTGTLFQARLLNTDPYGSSLITPFGLTFASSLDELSGSGLSEVVGTDPNLRYFSFGYNDNIQLVQEVGFYFTFDVGLDRIVMIDVLSECA